MDKNVLRKVCKLITIHRDYSLRFRALIKQSRLFDGNVIHPPAETRERFLARPIWLDPGGKVFTIRFGPLRGNQRKRKEGENAPLLQKPFLVYESRPRSFASVHSTTFIILRTSQTLTNLFLTISYFREPTINGSHLDSWFPTPCFRPIARPRLD